LVFDANAQQDWIFVTKGGKKISKTELLQEQEADEEVRVVKKLVECGQ
jgi:hypothetical protein